MQFSGYLGAAELNVKQKVLCNHQHLIYVLKLFVGDFRNDFVSDPSVNPKGMSIAFWAKITFTVDGTEKFILR